MPEPEELVVEGAHHATTFVRGLWSRRGSGARDDVLQLADVKTRLELLVHAACGVSLSVTVAEPPAPPTWLARLYGRTPRHLRADTAAASTDGERLRLPRTLQAGAAGLAPFARYRLMAVGLGLRAARGTPSYLLTDPLVRDLFLIREASAMAQQMAADLPGLLPDLRAASAAALAARPRAALLTQVEAHVEAELRAVLAFETDPAGDPAASRAWAEAKAEAARALGGPYRGLPPVEVWGDVHAPPPEAPTQLGTPEAEDDRLPAARRVSLMNRRPRVREAAEDEDDAHPGMWMVQLDDPQEHVEDPMGLQRPTDRDDAADPDGLADSLSELPEARLVSTPGRAREVLTSEDPFASRPVERPAEAASSTALVYPEWDYRINAYHVRGAVVRVRVPAPGDPAWVAGVRARRAALLHLVRRRFERLRARRVRLGRQEDGPEVDLSAYVDAYADARAGGPPTERLYEAVRHARRDVAIALLVDVSASTDAWATEHLRVVDVEKETLVVVCDALDALGDPYALFAFSGEGPEAVSLLALKDFSERNGPLVSARIAALEPDRYTRLGAAIRHATAVLMKQAATHRLLLVLTDGKPNDVDRYEGRYGIEDTRQAVIEARLQGLHPFALTVDRGAPAYMPRLFGAGAYAVLPHPERLPSVLVDVLRRLVQV